MASITQTVQNYTSGLSEQPDQFKNPGQVSEALNVVPDITTGLVKRPGCRFLKRLDANVNVTWFHYYRDDNEQYLGQIKKGSKSQDMVKIWDIKTGEPINISSINQEMQDYLFHVGDEDLQFLTINDYTYINNRTVPTKMDETTTTNTKPNEFCAYVELKKTANARQYAINMFDQNAVTEETHTVTRIEAVSYLNNDNSIPIETRVFPFHTPIGEKETDGGDNVDHRPKKSSGNSSEGGNAANIVTLVNEPSCPDIGTQVFSFSNYTEDTAITEIWAKGDWEDGGTGNPLFKRSYADGVAEDVAVTHNGQSYTNGWKTSHGRGPGGTGFVPRNLVWRYAVTGSSNRRADPNASDSTPSRVDYECTYNYEADLLFGGEGWYVGDRITFEMPTKAPGGSKIKYQIEVKEIIKTKLRSRLSDDGPGLGNGDIRPTPTAFDGDTAVTASAILGGIQAEISALPEACGFTTKIIGPGIYITRDKKFNIETGEADLMNIITDEVNDVTKLPTQCANGYIVKVSNSDADEDDYYMKFNGRDGDDGPGSWQECAVPSTSTKTFRKDFDKKTMPLQLVRQSGGDFRIQQVEWPGREVGDDLTNGQPSFVGSVINKVLFWRNRIVLLSSNNVIASQPGDANITEPNFWGKTALTVSPEDVIDLSASSNFPSTLRDGLEVSAGLILFSANQQFLLTAEAEVLNPETAHINPISTYNYNVANPPFSLGTTAGFIDNAGKQSRFFEMTNVIRGAEPEILEQSKVVPSLLPKNIDLVTNSRENNYVFFAQSNTDTVYGYRYFNSGEKRLQSAWFKWKLHKTIRYHAVIDDTYYVVLDNFNLVAFDLREDDISSSMVTVQNNANPNELNLKIHLDNYTHVESSAFNYDSEKNQTTVNIGDYGLEPNKTIAVLDNTPNDTTYKDFGRYVEAPVVGNIATLPGEWGYHKLYIGYNFDMKIKFPTIYPTQSLGEATYSNVNDSLVVHRVKLSLGAAGYYETLLERVGKPDYAELIESTIQDTYTSDTTPWLEQRIHTIPAYERNKNLTVYLKSSHPSPTTLYSMSWEGDYNNNYYQRA